MTSKINLTDKWARIHLARLCSALVYAEWTSTQTFVSGVGAPMWRMLVMLATRCVCHPVWLHNLNTQSVFKLHGKHMVH